MGIYGRNYSFVIRVPSTIMGKTEFKVEYHSLSKAILGRLIHWPGDMIKDFYFKNKPEKYEALIKLEPRLALHGLYSDNVRKNVVGNTEISMYVHCQSQKHAEPHRIIIKSLTLESDPIIRPSLGVRCPAEDQSYSGVKYTDNEIHHNCKHIENIRDILRNPIPSKDPNDPDNSPDIRKIRFKDKVTKQKILGNVQQIFFPVLDPQSAFGREVVVEFIDKYFFTETLRTTDKGKIYRTWSQYECDLYFYLKYGNQLLCEKARNSIGYDQHRVRCGWEVLKGETGEKDRVINKKYDIPLTKAGYARAGTILDVKGNFDNLSLDDKTFELRDSNRIVWERLLPSFDGYVRSYPKGRGHWTMIGRPIGGRVEVDKLRNYSDQEIEIGGKKIKMSWDKLKKDRARVVKDSVTDDCSLELHLSDPNRVNEYVVILEHIHDFCTNSS